MQQIQKRFLKDSNAVTAIEFALIAPIFFLLLIGIVEFGLTIFMDSSLNTGLRAFARDHTTAEYGSDTSDVCNDITACMQNYTAGIYDPSKSAVSSHIYANFNALEKDTALFQTGGPDVFFNGKAGNKTVLNIPSISGDASGSQARGELVLYYMKYKWGGITQLLSPYIPKDLYIFAIVRNECAADATLTNGVCTAN